MFFACTSVQWRSTEALWWRFIVHLLQNRRKWTLTSAVPHLKIDPIQQFELPSGAFKVQTPGGNKSKMANVVFVNMVTLSWGHRRGRKHQKIYSTFHDNRKICKSTALHRLFSNRLVVKPPAGRMPFLRPGNTPDGSPLQDDGAAIIKKKGASRSVPFLLWQ